MAQPALDAAAATGNASIRYTTMATVVFFVLHDADYVLARQLLAAVPAPESVEVGFTRSAILAVRLFAQLLRQAPGSLLHTAVNIMKTDNKFGLRKWGPLHAGFAARECARIGDLAQARAWMARAANLAEKCGYEDKPAWRNGLVGLSASGIRLRRAC